VRGEGREGKRRAGQREGREVVRVKKNEITD
jgi:hypothetical protein